MKNIKDLLCMAAALCVSAMTACNDIDVNDRFIDLPPVEGNRVVLLEEFTGQKCVNCPNAHDVISDLTAQYPDNFIAVSIHAGSDMNAYGEDQLPNGLGLRTPDGAAYGEAYKISAFPAGVVNRTSGVTTMDQWASLIRTEMAKPFDLDLKIKARLSADGKKIEVTADASPYANIDGHLQLWVVESGIVSLQYTSKGIDAQYVHNHVFRGVVNGHNGEPVKLVTREPQQFSAEVEVGQYWNPENLSIVGFVYTGSGVVQAAHAEVEGAVAAE